MEKIIFQNKEEEKLVGILSKVTNKKIVLLCHGFTSSKDTNTYKILEKEINKIGISTFRFDFSGHGESEGKKEDLLIDKGISEIKSAINTLKEKGFDEFLVFGSSRAGIFALRASKEMPEIKKLILISTGSSLENYEERNKIAEKINIQTLIIHGDKDEIVPFQRSEELAKHLPNCQLEIIKDGVHTNFNETPKNKEQRLKLITEFIKKEFI